MSASGLGRVKTYWEKRLARRDLGKVARARSFFRVGGFFRAESASDANFSRLE
jgi:hypothetical protein